MLLSRKVKSFQKIMRNLVFDFKCRLNLSDNDLVKSTLFKNVADGSKLKKIIGMDLIFKLLVFVKKKCDV